MIGYECGALPEVIAGGGLLVPEGDIGALEVEVERYLKLPASARDIARLRARERAGAFTNDKLADRLVDLWRELIDA